MQHASQSSAHVLNLCLQVPDEVRGCGAQQAGCLLDLFCVREWPFLGQRGLEQTFNLMSKFCLEAHAT